MQLSFLPSFSSWKSPSLGRRVPEPQVFTNSPAAKVSHTPQGYVSHLLNEGDWTCCRTLVLTEAQCQWTSGSEASVDEDDEVASSGQGHVIGW